MITKTAYGLLIISFLGYTRCIHTVQLTQGDLAGRNVQGINVTTKNSAQFRFAERQYGVQSDSVVGLGAEVLRDSIGLPTSRAIADSDLTTIEARQVNRDVVLGIIGAAVIIGGTYTWFSQLDTHGGDKAIEMALGYHHGW